MERGRQPRPDSFEALTDEEKAAARRARLYATLKAHGNLGLYYQLYPDERPVAPLRSLARDDDGERGR